NPRPGRPFPLMERGPILDVVASDERDRTFNVQVHVGDGPAVLQRGLLHLMRLSTRRETADSEPSRTIGISVLQDTVLFPDHNDVCSVLRLHNVTDHRSLTDLLEI